MDNIKAILSVIIDRLRGLESMHIGGGVKFLLYGFLILFFIVFLSPKQQLYFYLEEKLQPYKIIIYQEKIEPLNTGIWLKDGMVSYDKIFIGLFSNIVINTYFFKTNIVVDGFLIDKDFEMFIPSKIDKIALSHSIVNPLNVIIEAKGEFGELDGTYDFISGKLKLKLKPSDIMKTKKASLKLMTKTKDGYKYEK